MDDSARIPVGVVGTASYGAVQLVRLLLDHPRLNLVYLGEERATGQPFSDLYPHLLHQVQFPIEPIDVETIAQRCQVVFLCLAHGDAVDLVPTLLEKGCRVLDLSADYRFADLNTYSLWYGIPRTDHAIAETAIYGLPELNRDRIADAQLIGCPGSYPTASLLALAPLYKQGLIVPETAIIDAKAGTSSAGRVAQVPMLLSEADSSLSAYSVARHRHTPEIEQVCSDLAGHEVLIQLTPHLVPMVRGMLATVYATLRDPGLVRDDLLTIYGAFYRSSPWVKLLPSGVYPQTKWACGTNLCYIGIEVDPRTSRVIVMSAIDNLLKGQSGQAIQCLNLMMGWDETLGLPQLSFYP
jgi:N-acetyl-gamma-glutamyl-phosphate reductase